MTDYTQTLEDFHQALHKFSSEVATRYQDDDLDWELHEKIRANFPWYYIHYTVTGAMAWPALKALETEYQTFCKEHGASFETLIISANTKHEMNVKVKLIYNPVKLVKEHVCTPVMDKDDHETYTCSAPGCGKTFPK